MIESEGKIAATAFLVLCADVMYSNQPFAVLENIVVDSDFRRLGIGIALMSKIKDHCKEHRCTKVMLLRSEKRLEAHAFFRKCGYQDSSKRGFVN
ncbi:MAG: GNAT family N-acetyltransferase, partial [Pseudobdellovibrionaceae bacterium]